MATVCAIKKAERSGTSLVLRLTREFKALDIDKGDLVVVNIRKLAKGHVLPDFSVKEDD